MNKRLTNATVLCVYVFMENCRKQQEGEGTYDPDSMCQHVQSRKLRATSALTLSTFRAYPNNCSYGGEQGDVRTNDPRSLSGFC